MSIVTRVEFEGVFKSSSILMMCPTVRVFAGGGQ